MRLCAALLLPAASSTGCVGYLMGWSDAEADRLRGIVAELEAKNCALVEDCIGLRRRVRELEQERAPSSGSTHGVGPQSGACLSTDMADAPGRDEGGGRPPQADGGAPGELPCKN